MRRPKYITSFNGFYNIEISALCLCHPINVFRLSVIRQRKFKRMKSEQQDQNKFTKERFSKSMAQSRWSFFHSPMTTVCYPTSSFENLFKTLNLTQAKFIFVFPKSRRSSQFFSYDQFPAINCCLKFLLQK